MTWTRDNVRGELLKLFAQHSEVGAELKESSHIIADLGIDSLGVAEIIGDIEDKFELKIPDDALREVDTVADVASAIEVRLKGAGRLEG
jgi:acyl carrier protein